MLNNKKVFISGGAGVIGKELVPKLLSKGAKVLVGDLKERPINWPSSVKYIKGDLNNLNSKTLENFAPEFFIHLAATFERSEEKYEFFPENFRHNVNLSNHLLEITRHLPSIRKIIFASSYLIYDQNLYTFTEPPLKAISLKEGDIVSPRNLTGMAKYNHEFELNFLQKHIKDVDIICARIFRGYGRGSRDVISRWVRNLINDEEIKVFKGEGIFDYINSEDSAEGLIRLAETSKKSGIVNLGTGNACSINSVIKILRGHFPEMKVEQLESSIKFEASQADISKLKRWTGWCPEITLEKGIKLVIDYERARLRYASALKQPVNILLSSSGNKLPLLREMEKAANRFCEGSIIIAGDINDNCLTFQYAKQNLVLPQTRNENLKEIIEKCVSNNIKVILPSRDGELEFYSYNKKEFIKHGITVIVSEYDSICRTSDKLQFYDFCRENKIPCIATSENLLQIGSDRIVVKERFGSGSENIGIDLTVEQAAIKATHLKYPVFQPFISGEELSIDAWCHENACDLYLRRRVLVSHGESQVTKGVIDQSIEQKIKKYLKCLELTGPVVLQIIIDENKNIHVVECNARFGGASTASIHAGLDLLYWAILFATGFKGEIVFQENKPIITQRRIPVDEHVHDFCF